MSQRELDRLIRRARGAGAPSAADRSRVRAALSVRVASGEAAPHLDTGALSQALARPGWMSAGAASMGIGLLAVGALAAYVYGRDPPSDPPPTHEAKAPMSQPLGAVGNATGSAGASSAGSSGGVGAGPAPRAAPPQRTAPAPGISPNASPVRASSAAPTAGTTHAASAKPAGRAMRVASAAQASSPAQASNPAQASSPAQATAGGRAPRLDREAERLALARVQRALRDGRFSDALAELDEADRAFAGGALNEERSAARVLGTCGQGDATKARQLAAAFAARHPASPLRARVLASCQPARREQRP